jgi:AraC-like DNA-binding protein
MHRDSPPLSQAAGDYQEWSPIAPLSEHIHRLWIHNLSNSPVSQFQVVPDACVDIIWTATAILVAGPDTRPVLEQFPPQGLAVGARFHPGAAHRWLSVPLNELLNQRVPLAEFWPDEAPRLHAELSQAPDAATIARELEQALVVRLERFKPPDRRIAFLRNAVAKEATSGSLGIKTLADQANLSERTLHRRALEAFGYSLKTLHRIVRFRTFSSLAARHPNPKLVDLATEAGFADQSHLTREVQRLANMTPAQYLAQMHR